MRNQQGRGCLSVDKKMSDKELEEKFGISAEQIQQWDEMMMRGEIPGEPVGEVIVGRPLKFGEELKMIGFKDTERNIEDMDRRAESLGMCRSDYLRWVVHNDLATAV